MKDVELVRQWCLTQGHPVPGEAAVESLLGGLGLGELRQSLTAQYCDDIRREVGGKTTLVGVYEADLLVPTFPAVLPKLCIRITAITPDSRPFEMLRWIVTYNDDVLFDGDYLAHDSTPRDEAGEKWQMHRLEAMLSPFEVKEAGVLRARVQTENGLLRANALRIAAVTPTSSAE